MSGEHVRVQERLAGLQLRPVHSILAVSQRGILQRTQPVCLRRGGGEQRRSRSVQQSRHQRYAPVNLLFFFYELLSNFIGPRMGERGKCSNPCQRNDELLLNAPGERITKYCIRKEDRYLSFYGRISQITYLGAIGMRGQEDLVLTLLKSAMV